MSRGTQSPRTSGAQAPLTPHLASVLDRCLRALEDRPAALITDIDGTISRIAARPDDAYVEPVARSALAGLARTLDLVAVVTAREQPKAERMVGAGGVTYVGNYGLVPGTRIDGLDGIVRARREAEPHLAGIPCTELEDKGVSFSVHYRNCDDADAVRVTLLDLLSPLATSANARLVEGKKVVELVPLQLPGKRNAFVHLIDEHGIRGLVYLGDDLSDVMVFNEIRGRREAGGLNGLGIAVTDGESDPGVIQAADVTIGGVDDVCVLLPALQRALAEGKGDD
jgi:trehalose 6-phosphate phosphatase